MRVLALALMLGAGSGARAQTAPEEVPAPDGPWALELIVAAEPEQPNDEPCNVGVDCLTGAKAFFGGAVRGAFHRGIWSASTTLGLATLVDQEERPPSYGAITWRADVQIELARGPDSFGGALRVSPTLVYAWSRGGHAFATDIPGFALLLGTAWLWGEVGLPTLPSPADPRQFYAACGFVLDRWSGTAGVATFATLGYAADEVARAGGAPGAYGDVTVRVSARFDLRVMAVLSSPVMFSVGFGWRFAE